MIGATCPPNSQTKDGSDTHHVVDDGDGFREALNHPAICCLTGKSATRLSFGCPAPFAKIFWFSEDPNHLYICRRLIPHEGRIAIVTDAG